VALFSKKRPDGLDKDKNQADGRKDTTSNRHEALGSETPGSEPNRISVQSRNSDDSSRLSSGENTVGSIGKSIVVKGELTGSEDVEIDGTVEGDIRLPEHVLTIGPNGQVSGSIHAKTIQILGNVKGDVGASERVEIESSGVVEGDLRAPRLLVQEGAVVNGSIEMTSGTSSKSALPQNGDKGEKTVQAV
jgi:cytoskeletal protein CcmA (bactofilin family)